MENKILFLDNKYYNQLHKKEEIELYRNDVFTLRKFSQFGYSLKDLQEQLNLTILFISHDLPVIRQMCDRVAILKKGCICEINQTESIFNNPKNLYTKELLRLMQKLNL